MAELHQPICLALVATVHGRFSDRPTDDLETADTTTVWLRSIGFTGVPALNPDDVDDVVALREAAFALLTALDDNSAVPRAALDEVNNALARPHSAVQIAADPARLDRLVRTHGDDRDSIDDILHRFGQDLVEVVVGDTAHRIRQCVTHSCGTFFIDTSRAGNRKWCSSATCGNRARVAAHRERILQDKVT